VREVTIVPPAAMTGLKLIALDSADLTVLATHLQDAVGTVADLAYRPRDRRFVAILNRFDWTETARNGGAGVRRQCALRIERVTGAQVQGVSLSEKAAPVSVLTLAFAQAKERGEDPSGWLTLVLAGGGAIRLAVECIEVQLEDLGPVWQAKAVPRHDLDKA
jgi:hypothetical protein